MKNKFLSKSVPRGTRTIWRYLGALFILFTFAIGQMWGAEIFGFTCTSSTTAVSSGGYTATGGTATLTGSAMSTGGTNELTIGTQTFYKFNSSSQWTFTLSSGKFAAGDVITFTCCCESGSDKSGKGVKINNSIAVTGDFPKNTTNTISYTVVASDGVAGQSSFYIKRNDSNIKFGTVSVTRSSGDTPVCPSGLSITSKNDKTAFLEGDAIELTAALTAGNGAITYQWYKGGTAEANKLTGKKAAKLEIASCVEGDAGDYYCVASKSDCSNAVNADAFTITVAHNPCATYFWFFSDADQTANGKTNATSVFSNMAGGGSNLSGSITIDETTYNVTRRTGDTNPLGGFTVPANKAATFYALAVSSGDGARKIVLTNTATSATYEADVEGGSGSYKRVQIDNIAPGTYSIGKSGGNTRLGMVALKVCDATFRTITLKYADGTSPDGSLSVLDGTAATKPADPTWAHHRFDGWYNGQTAYDWSANVTGDLTLTAHWTQLYTVTYAAGDGTATGDAPTQVDKAAGETFKVAANTFAVEGKDFDKWNDGTNDYNPDDTYTVGTENVVLTAQWKTASAKYTVIFKDGDTELGTKQFDVASNPSDADIDKTKSLFTFVAWQKDDADIALDAEFWATVVKDATVTLTARWAKAYAQSIDMEQFVLDNGKAGNWHAYLDSKGYAYASSDMSLDSLNGDKTKNNYQYLGLKFNKNSENTYVEGNLAAGKLMVVKVGAIGNNTYMKIDGAKVTEPAIVGGVEADSAAAYTYWYYDTDKTFSLFHENGGTSMLKAITITDPYQVSFNPNGGDPVASQDGTPSVILPDASNGTSSLLGWFDAAEGGNKIGDVGDSYTPTADIELFAHWEAVSTDARLASITFSATGTLSPAFDPEVTNYTYTMPYGTAAIPTITGATSVNAKAQDPIIGEAAAAWGEAQTVKGVAQSGDKKTYTITMVKAPKDGVSLIKVATTGGTNKTVTGVYAGDGDVKLSSDTKMNDGNYIGFTLEGTTLQAGDRINVHTTQAANTGGSHVIFFDNMTDKNELYDTEEIGGLGDNIFTINAAMVGATTAYVYRSNADAAHKWNGYVNYIEVTRAMNPVLTAITIDERAGVIDPLDDKHFNVQIPYEADLANLTIVPTIVWNEAAATNSIVVNDGSAWVLGPNTYKLTDKDGDYTVYTITLTRDVLKHTVSFNTHGGSAVASVEVEDGAQLAAAPAAPEKEDYIFQGWAETADGAVVDVTSFTISAAKEFHAIWASDGAIKLITGTTVNTSDFITGLSVEDDEIGGVKLAGGVSDVNGVKDLTRVIAYNAKSNQTKIQIKAYNTNSSNRTFVVKGLVEGASEAVELASITLGNKETKTTEWIEFNNADVKNRTIYIFSSSSASDIRFLQVKVIDDGETATKVAGEVGYSLSFDHGRFFGLKATTAQFEGMSVDIASSDCQPLSSSVVKVKEASMSFTAAAPVLLKVTTANNKTYYVANSTSGTTNETAKTGESEFNLAAGTWFINAGASEVQFTNIAFELPKAEKPVVADLANVDYCQGSAIDELAVSATVSDGGTKLYQWYKDGVKIDGAEAATYQPTADGEYYVVVVNTKAGHQNSDPTQSNTITVTGHAGTAISGTTGAENWPGTDVTISVTATGKNLHYAWYTCDDAMGTNPVAVDPAVNAAELDVTIDAADTYYKVVVSGDCGSAQEAVITVVARQAVDLQDVTGNMTWDFSKANDGSAAGSNLCNDEVLANVVGIVNNSDFKSDNIKATANKFKSGKLQASMIKFHTTVDGMITVVFSNTGGKDTERYLTVNGRKTDKGSKTETAVTYTGFVYAGDVELGVVEGDGNMLNFTSVDFKATVDYPRPVNPNNIGTLCWTNDAVLGGATLYELAGKDANSKLVFDEVPENRLVAGKPYVFVPENGNTVIKVYNTTDDEPLTAPLDANKEMQGTFVDMTTVGTTEGNGDLWYKYIISNNHYIYVDYQNCNLGAYRAYFHSIDAIPAASEEPQQGSNGAPRRRLVVGGNNVPAVTTGVDNLNVGDQPIKVMIDGQMYILRGDKMYDATGRLVK